MSLSCWTSVIDRWQDLIKDIDSDREKIILRNDQSEMFNPLMTVSHKKVMTTTAIS